VREESERRAEGVGREMGEGQEQGGGAGGVRKQVERWLVVEEVERAWWSDE
jgi:hypothetical protein